MKLYWTYNKQPCPKVSGKSGMPKYGFYDREADGIPTCEVLDRDVDYLRAKWTCKTADEMGIVSEVIEVEEPEVEVAKPKKKKKGKAK